MSCQQQSKTHVDAVLQTAREKDNPNITGAKDATIVYNKYKRRSLISHVLPAESANRHTHTRKDAPAQREGVATAGGRNREDAYVKLCPGCVFFLIQMPPPDRAAMVGASPSIAADGGAACVRERLEHCISRARRSMKAAGQQPSLGAARNHPLAAD